MSALNSPSCFLSLHQNIQYYHTHKECNFSHQQIAGVIFEEIQKLYTGSSRDDKWIELIKKDIKKLGLDELKIDTLQCTTPKGPKPINWLKEHILNVVTVFDQDAIDDNG